MALAPDQFWETTPAAFAKMCAGYLWRRERQLDLAILTGRLDPKDIVPSRKLGESEVPGYTHW